MTDYAQWREVPTRVVEAGCAILYERVAEAYEPEYRELVMRIFDAMQSAYGSGGEKVGGGLSAGTN